MAGDCFLVNTRAEADSAHVYTLNPDYTIKLNDAYYYHWGRNARCDELQFPVDHNTSLSRLNSWLQSVAYSWYDDIGATHFNHQTVSTSRHEWFYVNNGTLQRIPDILTAWSWGLLLLDRLSIPYVHTDSFYNSVTIGAPLSFGDGAYADKINAIWKDGDRDYTTLPIRLAEKIDFFDDNSKGIFTDCTYQHPTVYPGNPWANLLDWSWMQRNPGCALAS